MEVEEVFARFRDIKHGIRARKRSNSIHFGEHKSGFKGAGYDIVGVERWRPGQPLKDVAWALSLRTYPEKIYKIERMEPKELRTLVVCDLSHSTLFQMSQESNKALLMLDLLGTNALADQFRTALVLQGGNAFPQGGIAGAIWQRLELFALARGVHQSFSGQHSGPAGNKCAAHAQIVCQGADMQAASAAEEASTSST